MKRVVIIGGGLSGLTVGFRLLQQSSDIALTLLESNAQPGGNVRTFHEQGYRLEAGPNGFLDSKRSTWELCHDLGIGDELIAASEGSRLNRFLFWKGKLHKLPGSPLGILQTPLLSMRGKLALLTEPLKRRSRDAPFPLTPNPSPPGARGERSPLTPNPSPPGARGGRSPLTPNPSPPGARGGRDETVHEFATRRFGKETADLFIDALVTGIHAADPKQLSVNAAFPRLPKFEQEHGSVIRGFLKAAKQRKKAGFGPSRMWSFPEGLQKLTDTLVSKLGDALQCNVRVQQLSHDESGWHIRTDNGQTIDADAVVVSCPAHAQANMLQSLDAELARELARIPFTPVVVVGLGYAKADLPNQPDGFGYIAPQSTNRDILGMQWCSSIFPDRAPEGHVLWRALCGGMSRPEMIDWDDERLVRACHDEARLALHVRQPPRFSKVIRWPRAIPQYTPEHPARVERIEALARNHHGLILTGNSLRGVAMNDVTEDAARIAREVHEF